MEVMFAKGGGCKVWKEMFRKERQCMKINVLKREAKREVKCLLREVKHGGICFEERDRQYMEVIVIQRMGI